MKETKDCFNSRESKKKLKTDLSSVTCKLSYDNNVKCPDIYQDKDKGNHVVLNAAGGIKEKEFKSQYQSK